MADPAIPLDTLREPAFLFDADGIVFAGNRAAERLAGDSPVGLSAAGLADRLALRLLDGRPPEAAQAAVRQALEGGEPPPLRGEVVADGSVSAVTIITAPVRDVGRIAGALSIWRDGTGRRPDREQAFHALLVYQKDEAVFATDTELRITAWNRAAEKLYGWPAEQAIGRLAREVIGPVTPAGDGKEALARFWQGARVQRPLLQHHRDGRPLIVEEHAAPVRAPDGTPIGLVAVVHDVTPQARLSGDLAESEAKYRNLVELSPDAILIHRDGAIVFANPAAADLVGAASPGDLVGRSLVELVNPRAREDVERKIDADLRGEESPLTTIELLRPDGTTVTVQGRGARIPLGGRPAVQLVLRDVTELRRAEIALAESEERLRDVLDVSLDAVYRHNFADDRYEYIGPINEELTGFSAEEFAAFSLEEFTDRIHPDDRPMVGAIVAEAMNGTSGTVEYRFRHRDGSYRWLADHFAFRTDAGGRVRYRDGVVRDVTRQHEEQEVLRRFAEELQRSNEELQRFAYVASHDLQEPLRSVVSFSQLLERRLADSGDPDVREFLGFIIEGGLRMQALIRDLLRLSRIETTARPAEPTDTGRVVVGVLTALETPIREAEATVTVGTLPVVMADEAQLGQVFANLIGNALKYRRPDTPLEVRIRAERVGPSWRFAVSDTGIGIEREYFDRIFVIFQRLHTRDAYPGTGIGLAVVKRIVERHGGRVGVESVPGEGSTFYFTMPAD
jgi:PAS domain S-box-containing protein